MFTGKHALVIDNGSGTCKVGFATDKEPRAVIPSIVGDPRAKDLAGDHIPTYVGEEAESRRGILRIRHPIEHGIITDWDDMQLLWQYAFETALGVAPEHHAVLLAESPLNPNANREKITEIMFETFKIPAAYLANQSALSIFTTGRTSGVVLDSGDGVTHSVAVRDGAAVADATTRSELAGRDLTNYLLKLLFESGCTVITGADRTPCRDIKEKLCYVAVQPHVEQATTETHQLPDGRSVTLGEERFRCAEPLFQPIILDMKEPGFHEMTRNSVAACDDALQKTLYRNVVLCGGNTAFPGFASRLAKEISAIVPPDVQVKVVAAPKGKHAAWLGGSLVASLPSFEQMWVTKQEYEEFGAAIVHKKCI